MTEREGRGNMAAPNLSTCFIIFFFVFFSSLLVPAELRPVSADRTAILSCPCLDVNKNVTGLMITSPDLQEGKYVAFWKDFILDPTNQSPKFSGRVNCSEDWTCRIQDMTSSDPDQYECRVFYNGPDPDSDPEEYNCSATVTNTTVTKPTVTNTMVPGGLSDLEIFFSFLGVIAGIVVFAGIGIVVVSMCKKEKEKKAGPLNISGDNSSEDNNNSSDDQGALLHNVPVRSPRLGQHEAVKFSAVCREEP
ncbi:uncharacterized protein LOC121504412 [Xyrichtys novacula]|uniref:Uncharacterized protein LOC121504412 n=1 Tax=Xyrichtys novacula TaxID=13765 RepID=A0AAV1EI12_XYRNO|nr:uncharacterized protein LOC121504412 [Xyrichtys novacula]